jgi:DNA-binding PadR family transcriptional regulator
MKQERTMMFFEQHRHYHHRAEEGGRGCAGRGSRKGGQFEAAWEMHRERSHGRGRKRMFDGSELRLVLLKLIADEPRHGYDLIKRIEELTQGAYAPSPGIVYPTLTMLEDMEQIAERRSEGSRKQFAVTETGQAQLAEKAEEVAALFARLAALGEARSRSDTTSVRRAMGNLRQVLMDKLDGDLKPDTLNELVALIDDAAQKIERL